MSAFADDFFAAEGPVIERLKAQCPTARAVLSAAEYSGIDPASQVLPALHVVYVGYSIEEAERQSIVQRWLVVSVTRHVAQPTLQAGNTFRRDSDAGRQVAQAIAALRSFNPVPGESLPMRLLAPPAAAFRDGLFYVPTLWSVKFYESLDNR